MIRRAAAVVFASALAALAPARALPASATAPRARSRALPAPATTAAPQELILTPPAGTVLTVDGYYRTPAHTCKAHRPFPLRAKYRGPLHVVRDSNGRLHLINDVSFPQYLHGLAEVPASWPAAALRAQAIAARSYAYFELRHRSSSAIARHYDICASDQCQVYRGAAIELGAFGERWVAAVDATQGRALTYGGGVIQAFFFSTSDGHTRSSFPGGTPEPWLPSVSGEDADAPLARWTARVRASDLAAVLAARGDRVNVGITGVRASGDKIRVYGPSGSIALSRDEFRNALNDQAPCLFPSRYPTAGAADGSVLPQTIPSVTFSIAMRGATVVVTGRGWGHNVGMSQWGARSMAARGSTATQILHHFYGPAKIARVAEPAHIRVLAADGLSRIYVRTPPGVTVTDASGSAIAPGDRFEILGGSTLRVLRGRSTHIAAVLQAIVGAVTPSATQGDVVRVPFTLNRSARVRVRVRDAAGAIALQTPPKSFVGGASEIAIDTRTLAAGTYTVSVVADDGIDVVRSQEAAMTLAARAAPAPARTPGGASPWSWVVVGTSALVIAGVAFTFARRRRAASRT